MQIPDHKIIDLGDVMTTDITTLDLVSILSDIVDRSKDSIIVYSVNNPKWLEKAV
ncbi:MAG: CRISPR-associated endonuclease Cas2 [Nitrososphaeraceae archaeon]